MGYHVHIHYLVPGGALSPDGERWLPHKYHKWLIPERALAARFKKRFKAELDKLGLLDSIDPTVWNYRKKWVVDSIPAGSGEEALKYLAPYVYRTAISNNRIESLENGAVTFRFKDGTTGVWKHLTVTAEEFIRRFLQHVLAKGLVRVRYYGFLAAQKRGTILPIIRNVVGDSGLPPCHDSSPDSPPDSAHHDMKPQEQRCPRCGTALVVVRRLPRPPSERSPP